MRPETVQGGVMIRFNCPKCGTSYELGDELAGKKIRCGVCDEAFFLPATVQRQAAGCNPSPYAGPRRKGGGGSGLLILILLVLAGAGGGAAWMLMHPPSRQVAAPAVPPASPAPVSGTASAPAAHGIATSSPAVDSVVQSDAALTAKAASSAAAAPEAEPETAPAPQSSGEISTAVPVTAAASRLPPATGPMPPLPPIPAFAEVDKDQWFRIHPPPYGSYRPDNSASDAAKYWISIGPVGVRGLQHDREWAERPGFRKCFPKELLDASGNLVVNGFEVLDVWKGSPAEGKLLPGDLVVAVNGQPLASAQEYRPDWKFKAKEARSLQIFLGDKVEESEGRPDGLMTFRVLRRDLLRTDAGWTELPPCPPAEKLLYTGPRLAGGTRTADVDVDVSGFGKLVLRVGDAGDGNGSDAFAWCSPRLSGSAGERRLALTDWLSARTGWGQIHKGADLNGKPVTLNGKAVADCLGVHAVSEVSYAIPAGCTRFKATALLVGGGSVVPSVSAKKAEYALPDHMKPYLRDVSVNLVPLGRFSDTFPANCKKSQYMADYYAAFIAASQQEDGSWKRWAAYTTNMFDVTVCGLALLSTGDPKYDPAIRKAAYWVGYKSVYDHWAVNRAMPLLFLSEYYLRTKDAGIVPALKNAARICQESILFDYSAGHGTRLPGYADGALLLGLSYSAAALAVADKTPAGVDKILLSNVFDYIDRIGAEGFIPYGRTFLGSRRDIEVPSNSPALTGGALVGSLIYGGRKSFVDGATRMYVNNLGAGDGNHATATLGLFWTGLCLADTDTEAFHRHMRAFLWKFNISRTATDGFVQQACPMEYQGGEECMGLWWRTAGWVLALNAEKRNMAITGAPQYRAQRLIPEIACIQWQYSAWRYYQRNWAVAESVLGTHCPGRLRSALAALDQLKPDAGLHAKLFTLVKAEGPAICKLLMADRTLSDDLKSAAVELILGTEQRLYVEGSDTGTGCKITFTSAWPFRGYLYRGYGEDAAGYAKNQPLPVSGSAEVLDPENKLGKKIRFEFDSTARGTDWGGMTARKEEKVDLAKDALFTLPVRFDYRIGDMALKYTAPALFYGKKPDSMGDGRWCVLSARAIPVRGQIIRPPKGNELLFRVGRREIGCMNPDFFDAEWNGRTYHRGELWLDDGDECQFEYIPYTIWEAVCRQFKVLKRASIDVGGKITVTVAGTPGDLKALSDDNPETACEFRQPGPEQPVVLEFSLGGARAVNGAFLLADGGGTFSLEAFTGGKWVPLNWNNNGLSDCRTFDSVSASKFRFVINAGRVKVKEAHLYCNPNRK